MMSKFKAFTIAELIIALSILIGCVSGVIYSYFTFLDLAKTSKNTSLAIRVAEAKLEDIKSDSFDDIDVYANQVFWPDETNLYPEDIYFQNFNYRGIVYVDEISSNLKQITIIICWRQGERIVGADWVFDSVPDPLSHARPDSPAALSTLIARR